MDEEPFELPEGARDFKTITTSQLAKAEQNVAGAQEWFTTMVALHVSHMEDPAHTKPCRPPCQGMALFKAMQMLSETEVRMTLLAAIWRAADAYLKTA